MAYEDIKRTSERLRVLVLYESLHKRYVCLENCFFNDTVAVSDIFESDHI